MSEWVVCVCVCVCVRARAFVYTCHWCFACGMCVYVSVHPRANTHHYTTHSTHASTNASLSVQHGGECVPGRLERGVRLIHSDLSGSVGWLSRSWVVWYVEFVGRWVGRLIDLSVGWSVGWLVGWSVGLMINHL